MLLSITSSAANKLYCLCCVTSVLCYEVFVTLSLASHQETKCGDFKAVVVEVAGRAFYTGVSRFVQEPDDELTHGFLLK